MRIPEIQKRLFELAGLLDREDMLKIVRHEIADEIRILTSQLSRRPAQGRADTKSVRMTPVIRDAIIAFYKAHPFMPQTEIAAHFNVNPGRVSEALSGKRS